VKLAPSILAADFARLGAQVAEAENGGADRIHVDDQVLVMTVNPGFGHQYFIHSTLGKIERVRRMIDRVRPECELEVDGGIDPETARLCAEAGAKCAGRRVVDFWKQRDRA
jgi:pentose-5-phosphate-3-epimerase